MPLTRSTAPANAGAVTTDDREFLSKFELCTLPGCEWTHLAHIRVAWVCLGLARSDDAMWRIREGILRYNTEVLNRAHMYHETVTVAYTHIISDRMTSGECWTGFEQRIDDLLDRESPILLRYYSAARLFSDKARAAFIGPDIEALPTLKTMS